MTNIIGRIEDWVRAGRKSTPERISWAEDYVKSEMLAATRANFIPSIAAEPRPSITLSSHFYCPRSLWLKRNGKDVEDVAPRVYNNFQSGRAAECSINTRSILCGLPLLSPRFGTSSQARFWLSLPSGELRGSMDHILAAELMDKPFATREELEAYEAAKRPIIICDVKAMQDRSFDSSVAPLFGERLKEFNDEHTHLRASPGDLRVGNKFGYEDQLRNYATAAEDAGFRVESLWFLIHKKSTGHEAQIPCPLPDAAHRARISEALRVATSDPLPPRPSWATVKVVRAPGGAVEQIEDVRCGYCACRAACWPGFEQKVVSGKPVYRRPLEVV